MTDNLLKVREVKGCEKLEYNDFTDREFRHDWAFYAPDCNACLLLVQRFYGERAIELLTKLRCVLFKIGHAQDPNLVLTELEDAIRRAFGIEVANR